MSERRDKKFYCDLKRSIKRAGNKKRRAYYKQNLIEDPTEAHFCEEFDFGDFNSKQFNGMDFDKTRLRNQKTDVIDNDEDGWHNEEDSY